MADAYGTLIFSKSEDCIFSAVDLLNTLNTYKWASDCTQWCYDPNGDTLFANTLCTQYPTVFPKKINRVLVENENGEEEWVDFSSVNFDLARILDTEETDSIELADLCADISQSISTGWIEIGLSANVKLRDAYYQMLQVHANGKGVRLYCITGYGYPDGMEIEQV